MLLKSKISQHQLSLDPLLNEDYYKARLGKFTSSEWHCLMSDRESTRLNYIYRKVGERLSGRPARDNISVAATEHGLDYEREGLVKFGEKMGIVGLVKTQPLILDIDGMCGSTPDGVWITNDSEDGLYHNVRTIEVKCPYSFDEYIRGWKCKTTKKKKKEKSDWYWQVLHQMQICDCLDGYFVCYQPFFSKGGINVIPFNKLDITKNTTTKDKMNDFKLLNTRKEQAIKIFNETLKELTNV